MATNPFVAGLQSFAADPEGEAKGRYIMANTAKTQSEADILADRIRWRAKFGEAPDISPTAKAGELSNPTVDSKAAFQSTGVGSAQKMLFDTDRNGNLIPKATPPDSKTFSLASLLMGNAPNEVTSRMMGTGGYDKPVAPPKTDYKLHEFTDDNTKIHYRQLANEDGSPKFLSNGQPAMAPLNPETVRTMMPSAANGQVLQTSQPVGGGAPITTALNLPGSRLVDPSKLSQAARLAHANDVAARGVAPEGMSDMDFLIAKKMGHIGPDGKINAAVPMLNPDEVDSIKNLADTIMGQDPMIPLSVAVSAAIDHHEDIARGRIVTKDYDNRGVFDNFFGWGGADNEKDAAGVELPQFGGSKKYSTSQSYVRQTGGTTDAYKRKGQYSDLKEDMRIVPLAVRIAGDAVDETGIPGILAGSTGKPEFSTPIPEKPSDLVAGQFYHEGSKFYVAELGPSGRTTLRLITNIKK